MTIQASGIDHIVLHVTHLDRAKRFYCEVLASPPTDRTTGRCSCMPASRAWRCSRSKGTPP